MQTTESYNLENAVGILKNEKMYFLFNVEYLIQYLHIHA